MELELSLVSVLSTALGKPSPWPSLHVVLVPSFLVPLRILGTDVRVHQRGEVEEASHPVADQDGQHHELQPRGVTSSLRDGLGKEGRHHERKALRAQYPFSQRNPRGQVLDRIRQGNALLDLPQDAGATYNAQHLHHFQAPCIFSPSNGLHKTVGKIVINQLRSSS